MTFFTPQERRPVSNYESSKDWILSADKEHLKANLLLYAVKSKLNPDLSRGGGCWQKTFQTCWRKSLHAQTSHAHTHTPTTPEAGRRMWGKAAVSRHLTLDSQIWCNLEFPCYLRKQKKNKSQVGFLLVWAEYCPHASRSFEKSSFLPWKSSPGENPAVSLLWGLSSPNYMCCSNKWPKTCEPFH